MTSRRDMIERVRKALQRSGGEPAPVPPPVDEAVVRLVERDEDLAGKFARRAEAVGMAVVRCDAHQVADKVIEILREAGAGRVACGVDDLQSAVLAAGCEPVDWRGDAASGDLYSADAAVSEADAAVAETGSIVCGAAAGEARGMSLVPPLHLAIVRERVIVADILDGARHGWAAPLPSALAMVTGPSKTADIEGVLVRGVHGPGRVVVLLVGRSRPADQ